MKSRLREVKKQPVKGYPTSSCVATEDPKALGFPPVSFISIPDLKIL